MATKNSLNTLASAAELNILDGATLSTAELNILDGATLTVTELNYVDWVTSAIQTQLDWKASSLWGDDNYVTDAEKTKLSNLSWTNSWDQTVTNSSDATSHTVTLSASGWSVQLIEGTNITLTTGGTGSAGTVTITASGGSWDVSKVWTPVNNQVGVRTGDWTLEGDAALTYDSTTDTLTSVNFAGALTGNVTGNVSWTAATVTGAAQAAITSVGTLTNLDVDNININWNTISSTAGTDLLITPLAWQQIVLDGTIEIDAGVVTWATSISSTTFVWALTGTASWNLVSGGALWTPSSWVATNLTGTASWLTAWNVTTNANLTGHITSTWNAAVLGSFTIAQLNTAVSDANIIPEAGGTFTWDISVPDEAYWVGWNGSVEVPTKNAVYDKIETISWGSGLTQPQVMARAFWWC